MDEINKTVLEEKKNEVRSNNSNDIDLLGIDKSLMDTEDFEQSERSQDNLNEFKDPNEIMDSPNNLIDNVQSGLVSTTRPLVTSIEDEMTSGEENPTSLLLSDCSELCDNVNVNGKSSLIDISSDPSDKASPIAATNELQHIGDVLSISGETGVSRPSEESAAVSSTIDDLAATFDKVPETRFEDIEPNPKDPKIDTKHPAGSESPIKSGFGAYESFAQPFAVKKQVAMEAETSSSVNKMSDCDCPFSPGSWFDPEKLHPTVAGYVYWRDIKKSGIAFGSSLVLLLSLKYFSLISVVAYVTLAVLSVTISFRIYKNVLQAVQKSNEGHPFKEYLDVDISLSHDKLKDTAEVLIQHVNCVTTKLRSLILVEDLFDTIKLGVLAWCLTYVGAWFNGITLVILGLVSVFTVPKVYETNKTQIDSYAEISRTKGKELIEMINAKMPLGKKKKEQ